MKRPHKIVAVYDVYNDAKFIRPSITSLIDYVDQVIVIDGRNNKISSDSTRCQANMANKFDKDFLKYYTENINGKENILKFVLDKTEENDWIIFIDACEAFMKQDISNLESIITNSDFDSQLCFSIPLIRIKFYNDFWHYDPNITICNNKVLKHSSKNLGLISKMFCFSDKSERKFDKNIEDIKIFLFNYNKVLSSEKHNVLEKYTGTHPWPIQASFKEARR